MVFILGNCDSATAAAAAAAIAATRAIEIKIN